MQHCITCLELLREITELIFSYQANSYMHFLLTLLLEYITLLDSVCFIRVVVTALLEYMVFVKIVLYPFEKWRHPDNRFGY